MISAFGKISQIMRMSIQWICLMGLAQNQYSSWHLMKIVITKSSPKSPDNIDIPVTIHTLQSRRNVISISHMFIFFWKHTRNFEKLSLVIIDFSKLSVNETPTTLILCIGPVASFVRFSGEPSMLEAEA